MIINRFAGEFQTCVDYYAAETYELCNYDPNFPVTVPCCQTCAGFEFVFNISYF